MLQLITVDRDELDLDGMLEAWRGFWQDVNPDGVPDSIASIADEFAGIPAPNDEERELHSALLEDGSLVFLPIHEPAVEDVFRCIDGQEYGTEDLDINEADAYGVVLEIIGHHVTLYPALYDGTSGPFPRLRLAQDASVAEDALLAFMTQYVRRSDDAAEGTGEGPDERTKRAMAAFDRANSVVPKAGLFGAYISDDGPGYAGGGMGLFGWFKSWDELLDFVGEHLAFLSGHSDNDFAAVGAEVRAAVARLKSGTSSRNDALAAINEAGKGYSQIEWWGKADELLTDTGEFARKLRAEWREATEEEVDADADLEAPIGKKDAKDFLASLEGYGA